MRKFTKIVATISDQRCEVDFLKALYAAGMNVARLNTAHADFDQMKMVISNIRTVSEKIAILVDTKGPEIRTTKCDAPIQLEEGQLIKVLGSPDTISTSECICVSYDGFHSDVSVGSQVLIDDGEIALEVLSKDGATLNCKVLNKATVGSRKSVNVPGATIKLPSLTDKDRKFIRFAVENDLDFIAHSFVRNKQDVKDVQDLLDELKSPIKIIAKIENQEGIDNIDEIIENVYGIMVARGDLGIEVPQEKIPGLQRQLIRKCVEAKKPVIVATQMLHSMIKSPRPTRAEVTDVANAIYYRTDAIMLSGETAYGSYPVEAVQTMSKIAREVEKAKDSRNDIPVSGIKGDSTAFFSEAAVKAAKDIANIKAVLTDSLTGKTARYLAAFRGQLPIYALCYNKQVGRELNLSYGISPQLMVSGGSSAQNLESTLIKLKNKGVLTDTDMIIYLGGSRGIGGGTTYLEIISVADMLKKIDKFVG